MPVLSPHRSTSSSLSGSYRSTYSSSSDRPYYYPRISTYSERYSSRSYTDSDGTRVYSRSGSVTEDGYTTRFREETRDSVSRDSGISSLRETSLPLTESVEEFRNRYSPANYIPACQRKKEKERSLSLAELPPKRKVNNQQAANAAGDDANNTNVDDNGNVSVAEMRRRFDALSEERRRQAEGGRRREKASENGEMKSTNGVGGEEVNRNERRAGKEDGDGVGVRGGCSSAVKEDISASPRLNRNALPPTASASPPSSSAASGPSANGRESPPVYEMRKTILYGDEASADTTATVPNVASNVAKQLGLNGLKNIGNTCFMNSVIQCLSNTKLLLEYVKKDAYLADINTTASSMKGSLIKAFAQVIKELWSDDATDRVVNTVSLKSQIQRFAPRFMGYAQQDAQEFLRYLLEGLHEDVNRVTEKPKPIVTEIDEKLSDSEKALEAWRRYLRMDNSKIVDIFVGQLKSTLRCTHCGHCSVTFDPFWDLSLPIPQRTGQLRLSQCLDHFTKEETLDGDEKPTCSKCKERRRCTKSFSIQKFPKILVIHLKRFSPTERFRGKLSVTVDFPREGLDLRNYAADNPSECRYNLYAISNHSGTTYSGHYTAYCRHPYSLAWHEYNDSRVSSISPRSIVSGEAYVLFYELESQRSHL